jgi:hypothetical protein
MAANDGEWRPGAGDGSDDDEFDDERKTKKKGSSSRVKKEAKNERRIITKDKRDGMSLSIPLLHEAVIGYHIT